MNPPSAQNSRSNPPLLLKNARVIDPSRNLDESGAVLVIDGKIASAGASTQNQGTPESCKIIDGHGHIVAPGLVDMQVFVGEPGHEFRETLASASLAAAAGGITTIITMPDTDPVIDKAALVDYILRRARDTARVRVHPMAAISRRLIGAEMTELGLLTEAGAIAFTDGRKTVTDAGLMRRAMTYARDFNALISHHPEDPPLASGGVMNEGQRSTMLGLSGIPKEAELIILERDVRLAALSRCRYHAAQLSCAQSVPVIERAKSEDIDISSAVSINHLSLNENDIGPYRTFFKLSPPLRSEDDRQALIEGLNCGFVDVITSSHDPQDAEQKRQPFSEAGSGAIGLETMLAAGLRLVHSGDTNLTTLLGAMSTNPSRRLGLEAGTLARGARADIAVIDLETPWILKETDLISRSKNSPFEGARFQGRVIMTFVGGECVFSAEPEAIEPKFAKALS